MSYIISKEEGDKLLEDFLIDVTNRNGSKRCAEESYKILEDPLDCQLVMTVLFKTIFDKKKLTPKNVKEFENGILSALTTMMCCCDSEDLPKPLTPFFEDAKNDEEVFERVKNSKKLMYAVSEFAIAFMQYDYFESKYPEISKSL
jgi:hypothetical protein